MQPGPFSIDLDVTDDRGAISTCGTTAQIGVPNLPPICDAGGPYLGVVGASIHFDGSRSSDPDGAIVAYAWDFGDGATGSGPRPTHAYGGINIYTVGLCVTDDDGEVSCCFTTADIRDAGTPLTPVIGVEPETLDFGSCVPAGLCAELPLEIFNTVNDPRSILNVTGIQVAGSQFALAGGPEPPLAIPGDGTRVTYTVRFCATGDLATGALTVVAPGAANSPRNVPLRGAGNQVPVCDAGGPYTGLVGQPIHFDGSASRDPGGAIAAYAWSFGDGATGSGPTPTHMYVAPGSYAVGLAVTDGCGARSTCETSARIAQPPVCDAGGPYRGRPFETIYFDGTGSHDPDGTIVAYTWSFGDGTSGTGPTPTHVYGTINLYTVTLCVDDNDSLRSCCQTFADIYDLSTASELASFTAAASGGVVELRWRTSREADHAGFEVERATEGGGDYAVVSGERPVTHGDRDGAYAFDDRAVEGGATYLYRIAAIGLDGSRRHHGPLRVEVPRALPSALLLHPARPNPFSSSIAFAFELPGAGTVSVRVYDTAGRLVRTLADRAALPAGTHALAWDGLSDRGLALPTGIYVVRLETGGEVRAGKLALTR
jgi:chitodextrinase